MSSGRQRVPVHAREAPDDRGHDHDHGPGDHGHSHGLIDASIKRSREGVRAVLASLGVLGLAAVAQTLVYVVSGSVALLADLIHNFGDALTAVPLGIAFLLRSERAERTAGLFVVAAIFISACVAGAEAVQRLIHRSPPTHLWALAAAGAIGYLGNFIAAKVRTRTGRRLSSAGADRRRQPRRGRRLRIARGDRLRRRGGAGRVDRRSADRPGDHARDPAHHLAVLEHGPRPRPPARVDVLYAACAADHRCA